MSTKDIKDIVKLSNTRNFSGFKRGLVRYFRKEYTREELEERDYDIFLWEYFNLFNEYDILKDISYLHIIKGVSYEDITKLRDINKNTIRTTIYREVQWLLNEIGYNPLEEVKEGEEITQSHWETLKELRNSYNIRELNTEDNLRAFDLDFSVGDFDRGFNRNLQEDDFSELVEVLKYYSKPYRKFLEGNISDKYKGYVNHLLTTDKSELTDLDKDRRETLKHELMLDREDK